MEKVCDGTVDCQENGHDEQDCDGFRTHNLKNTYEKEGNITTGKGLFINYLTQRGLALALCLCIRPSI